MLWYSICFGATAKLSQESLHLSFLTDLNVSQPFFFSFPLWKEFTLSTCGLLTGNKLTSTCLLKSKAKTSMVRGQGKQPEHPCTQACFRWRERLPRLRSPGFRRVCPLRVWKSLGHIVWTCHATTSLMFWGNNYAGCLLSGFDGCASTLLPLLPWWLLQRLYFWIQNLAGSDFDNQGQCCMHQLSEKW